MTTKEELEDKIKTLSRKRDKAILDANNIQKELILLVEQLYEVEDKYVKIECFRCGGVGYIKAEDNKKRICDICNGKQYTWMKRYEKPK